MSSQCLLIQSDLKTFFVALLFDIVNQKATDRASTLDICVLGGLNLEPISWESNPQPLPSPFFNIHTSARQPNV